MSKKSGIVVSPALTALARALDAYDGRYRELKGGGTFGAYAAKPPPGADEERLVEPLLASILEDVLGFGKGDYFPQLGRGGLKPDFTPTDLITHPFVLDAKGSNESLGAHVPQIRRYVEQRGLRYGVLFNLKELRVYARGEARHDPSLSFSLAPLWEAARGERLPVGPDAEAFSRFCDLFSHRTLSTAEKIGYIRAQPSWAQRLEGAEVDVEFLVEQLRFLAGELAADAAFRSADLDGYLAADETRHERLLDELKQIALDVSPGVDVEQLPATVAAWREGDELAQRVWRQYLLRVAYLSLTRILLYRAWEDVGFVDEFLYDGGFDTAYAQLDENVRNVLKRAFTLGSERYRTLFQAESTYEWYRPSEDALVEVLYRLGAVPLGRLDRDALGALYVSYVDEIDRDRLGQFFTPREVVSFMLDRAGFAGPDGVFRVEGDERRPLHVFDFATGSGGFLVEAARRIIDATGGDSPKELGEALAAIAGGLYGGEISPFPYYLTEINLLLQVSRLLGRMRVAGIEPQPFVLGVVRTDSLGTMSTPAASFDVGAALRADHAELVHNIYDVFPVEPEKQGKYRDLRHDGTFDLVVGNPPYVAEPNNKPLFEHLRRLAAWKGIYRGKTDYLYYFLLLAIEKLRPGGRLCVITPTSWLNAGEAEFLRGRLTAELTLDEIFLFGDYRLFADEQGPAQTPLVESAILVATKAPAPRSHKLRVVVLEEAAAAGSSSKHDLLQEMARRVAGHTGRRRGIRVHAVRQASLRAGLPWPLKHNDEDLAPRVVVALESALDDAQLPVESLEVSWKPFMGIQTCADAYSKKIRQRLSPEARKRIDEAGAQVGDPICALPPGREETLPWREHPRCLVRSPAPEGLLYGAIDEEQYVSLVRLLASDSPPRAVLESLEPWKPVLETRAEIVRNQRRRWWETGWPRDSGDLAAPKVIALHRTDRGRFAVDETGGWSPSGRMCVIVGKYAGAPVAYLCGLLNSELLDLWYAVRGRTPRDVWRDYEPKPLRRVPYRRPEGDPRAELVAELVRAVAANRRALLPHRATVRDLGRIVKDPWRDGPIVLDRAALVRELPKAATISLRLDPALVVTVGTVPLGTPRRDGPGALAFRRGGAETGRIEGPECRLDLLEEVLGSGPVEDVRAVLLPRYLDAFDALATERAKVVSSLLAEGRRLVEKVERLVCALYGLPDQLADEVVAHAVRRAGSAAPDEPEEAEAAG